MKTLAIIPARGGSKRIERKNIRPFDGVPVIAYSIRSALLSGCFDEVMVSTDDEEIAEVAVKFGASVPFMRSPETSNDFATTADVIREVLRCYREKGREFDALACIYATAPFITAGRLAAAFEIIESGRAEAAFTCVEYSYPIQRSLVIDDNGRIGMKYPEYAASRSQDLQKTYHDAGQFYFTTVKAFEKCGSLWGADTLPVILPETEVQDLDTVTDWRLAELKYAMISFPKKINLDGYELVNYTLLDADESELMRLGRNEPDVRMQMVNTDEISREAHVSFVENLLTRRDRQYYAVRYAGSQGRSGIIGSITLDRIDPITVERGIWLFPDARGKGNAVRLLKSLYKYLHDEKGIEKVITTVRNTNGASLALERNLDAEKVSESGDFTSFQLKLN